MLLTSIHLRLRLSASLRLRNLTKLIFTLVHNCLCPVSPRTYPQFKDFLWQELAGTCCESCSSIGRNGKWLHKSTLPLLTFAYSSSYMEIDVVSLECTKDLEHSELQKCFDKHAHRVVSPTGRPLRHGQGLESSACLGAGLFWMALIKHGLILMLLVMCCFSVHCCPICTHHVLSTSAFEETAGRSSIGRLYDFNVMVEFRLIGFVMLQRDVVWP